MSCYPHLTLVFLPSSSQIGRKVLVNQATTKSHQIEQGSCYCSTFLLSISHSTPGTFPHVGCVNSSSLLFGLRTALPMMLNWALEVNSSPQNLPPPMFRASSGSTFFLPGPNLSGVCDAHSSICCLGEDDFSSFSTLLSVFSCFSVHFLLDCFHVDLDVDSICSNGFSDQHPSSLFLTPSSVTPPPPTSFCSRPSTHSQHLHHKTAPPALVFPVAPCFSLPPLFSHYKKA